MPEVPAVPGTSALGAAVARVFSSDGPLARAIPNFEPRPSQCAMALSVAEAFERGNQVLIEAGTGTGKTLAYLVPAIVSRQRVLVSTGTKNLQEQIYFKDLPILAGVLGIRFTAAYMKGRANYLCLHRLEVIREYGTQGSLAPEAGGGRGSRRNRKRRGTRPATLVAGDADHYLPRIFEWALTTETGDRAELGDLPEDLSAWNEVAATSETCLGANCPHYNDCFVTRMRQRAAAADIVIVNHHLLCADAAVRQGDFGQVIPACANAVIDEAHQLEDVATQYFGISVSNRRVEELCRDAALVIATQGSAEGRGQRGPAGGRQGAGTWSPALEQSLERVRDRARALFLSLQLGRMARENGSAWGDERVRLSATLLAEHAEAGGEVLGALGQVEATALAVKDPPEALLSIARRAGELRDQLRFLLSVADPDYVYYTETRGHGVFLRASPIEVSNIVRTQLLERFKSVILTSATLSVAGSFDYIRSRLGVRPASQVQLASEFDYERQAILYLPAWIPDPRSPGFAGAAAAEIVEILKRSRGRAFVLFTSYAVLRAVLPLVEAGVQFPVLVQGTAPRSALLQQFRTTPHAVMLATSSFWQGVDVAGEQLSCVIVDKLPFASPADPVTSARMEAIARRGGEPFWEYAVPLAVLTLQQGLGRLIRHREDRGVMCVLDPRLRTKRYGRTFLQALPRAPVTTSLDEVSRFFS